MVFPRSGLATKGIVLCDLINHDSIKSFSYHILKRLHLQQIFFRWDERLYNDLYFDYIFIGNDRQSDGIHGNPRENWFPWSCSDIFSIHNISPTKSIANQSLLITNIFLRHATRSSGAWQDKTAAWETNSLRALPVIMSSRKASPHKKTSEALRDKTKNCCTGLTCRHDNAKSRYCYYILLLTIWYNESSSQRAKKKITKTILSHFAFYSLYL